MANYPTSKDTQGSLLEATNRARTTLAQGIDAVALTIQLTDATNFPNDNFLLSINEEIMLIESRVGENLTVAPNGRGYEGTVATTHPVSSIATNSFTALQRNNLRDTIIDQQNYVWTYRGTALTDDTIDPSTLTPAQAEQHIVPVGAIGDWAGNDSALATFDGTVWAFTPPEDGFSVYVLATSKMMRYDDTLKTWRAEFGSILDYDPAQPYPKGSWIDHNLKLYKANKDVAAGTPFSIADWDAVHRTPTLEAWDVATEYYSGDLVSHTNRTWVCVSPANTGTEPGKNIAVWNLHTSTHEWVSDGQYQAGQLIVHDMRFWMALVDVTIVNPEPGTDSTIWYAVAPTDAEYSPSRGYMPGDLVYSDGRMFIAVSDISTGGPTPGTDPTLWVAADITPSWSNLNVYVEGELVWYGGQYWRWDSATNSAPGDEPSVAAGWIAVAAKLDDILDVDTTGMVNGQVLKRDEFAPAGTNYTPALPIEERTVGDTYTPGEVIIHYPTNRVYRVAIQHVAAVLIENDITAGNIVTLSTMEFPDNEFIIYDEVEPSRRFQFTANRIANGQARDVGVPDRDIYLGTVPNDYQAGAHYLAGDICLQAEVMYRALVELPSAPAIFDPAQWRAIPVGGGDTNVHVDTRYQADMQKAFPNPYRNQNPQNHRLFVSGATSPIECVGMYEQIDDIGGRIAYEKVQSGLTYRVSYSNGTWRLQDVTNGATLFTAPNADRPGYIAPGGWSPGTGSGELVTNEFFPPYFTGAQGVAERYVADTYDAAQPWITLATLPFNGAYRVSLSTSQSSRHPALCIDLSLSWGNAAISATSSYYSASALEAIRVMSNITDQKVLLQLKFGSALDNASSDFSIQIDGATSRNFQYVRFDELPRTGDTITGYAEKAALDSGLSSRRGWFSENVTTDQLYSTTAQLDTVNCGRIESTEVYAQNMPRILVATQIGNSVNLRTDGHVTFFSQDMSGLGLVGTRRILAQVFPRFIAGTTPDQNAYAWMTIDGRYGGDGSVIMPLQGREGMSTSMLGSVPCAFITNKTSAQTLQLEARIDGGASVSLNPQTTIVLYDMGPA